MTRQPRSLASVALVGIALSGCPSVTVYTRPVKTFREGYTAAAPALREVYTRVNDFRREAWFTRALCDPTLEIVEVGTDGQPTPLNHNEFSAESIQARVDTVELLGRYADRLAAVATADADGEGRIATTATELTTHLGQLGQRFGVLEDVSASSYAGPVGQIVGAVVQAYRDRRRIQTLRDTVLRAAEPVRAVLDLLERDLAEITRQVHAPTHDVVIARCAMYYNDHRAGWSDGERRAVLTHLQSLVDRRERFRASDPVELVRAMREAHEALVRFVRDGGRDDRGRLAELANSMDNFAHRVDVVSAALRALRGDPPASSGGGSSGSAASAPNAPNTSSAANTTTGATRR